MSFGKRAGPSQACSRMSKYIKYVIPVQSDGDRPCQRDEQRPTNSSDAEEYHQYAQYRPGQNHDGTEGTFAIKDL